MALGLPPVLQGLQREVDTLRAAASKVATAAERRELAAVPVGASRHAKSEAATEAATR